MSASKTLTGKYGTGKDESGKNTYLIGQIEVEYPETLDEAVTLMGADSVYDIWSTAVVILAGNKIRQQIAHLVEEKGQDVTPFEISGHISENMTAFPDFLTEKTDRKAIGKARSINTVIDSVAKGFSAALGILVIEWDDGTKDRFSSVVIPELEKRGISVDAGIINARLETLS